jgi:predicted lactoylglutathione lyase
VRNVEQAVPFFLVSSMKSSLEFYVVGLGFEMTKQWIDAGELRWCWLQIGGAALMLQEYRKERLQAVLRETRLGEGVSVCFQCNDALAIHREAASHGIEPATTPFVGNHMWVVPYRDPDGYRIDFESPTDVPEETVLS